MTNDKPDAWMRNSSLYFGIYGWKQGAVSEKKLYQNDIALYRTDHPKVRELFDAARAALPFVDTRATTIDLNATSIQHGDVAERLAAALNAFRTPCPSEQESGHE